MAIGKLVEVLHQRNSTKRSRGSSSSSEGFDDRLDDAEVREGLKNLLGLLAEGISVRDDSTRGFQHWPNSLLQAVVFLLQSVVAACSSMRNDNENSLVSSVFEMAVDFCLCYLDSHSLCWPPPHDQDIVLHLLDMTLVDAQVKEVDSSLARQMQNLEDYLPDFYPEFCLEGSDRKKSCFVKDDQLCMKGGSAVAKAIAFLASDDLSLDGEQSIVLEEPVNLKNDSDMTDFAQHYAVFHLSCIDRVLEICKKLIGSLHDSEESLFEKVQFVASLVAKLLKLLGSLANVTVLFLSNNEILLKICEFVKVLQSLFKLDFEIGTKETVDTESSTECLFSIVLEAFLQFVHDAILDVESFENVRAFVLASLLEILDGKVYHYDKLNVVQKLPLVCKPDVVRKIIRLIRDIGVHNKKLSSRQISSETHKEVKDKNEGSISINCQVRGLSYNLLEMWGRDERLNILFPQGGRWMENLLMLVFYLHSQAMKTKLKGEKSLTTVSRDGSIINDVDSFSGHEDDALFGDLFSEANKQASVDSQDKLSPFNVDGSDTTNVPLQGAVEILDFLKDCILSPNWHYSICKEALNQLSYGHLSILLQMLHSQVLIHEERIEDHASSRVFLENHNFSLFYKACFNLLHDLVTIHGLPCDLEEKLVKYVLKLDDGKYAYTDDALVLVTHIIVKRAAKTHTSVDDPLRLDILKGYATFVVEKVQNVYSGPITMNELISSMPSLFHLELVLMSFNSANRSEKIMMASTVFHSLRKVSFPPPDLSSTQYSLWALLISRLILICRHMILYPKTFPSWLMLHLRNRMRQRVQKGGSPLNTGVGCLESWTSHVLQNVLTEGVTEEHTMDDFFQQLVDVSGTYLTVPQSLAEDLSLDYPEVFSTICSLLNAWQEIKANKIEDFILERYCFSLGWSTLLSSGFVSACSPVTIDTKQTNLLSIRNFICVSQILCGSSDLFKGENQLNLAPILCVILSQLETFYKGNSSKDSSWLHFRHNSWLSLVMSLLQAGFWRLNVKNFPFLVHKSNWTENTSTDVSLLGFCEQLAFFMVENKKFGFLLEIFISLLIIQVRNVHAALMVFDQSGCEGMTPLSRSLLLRSGLEKSKQDELWGKMDMNYKIVASVLENLPKLVAVVNKENTSNMNKIFMKSLLHGFPSYVHSGSCTVASFFLSVEELLHSVEHILRANLSLGTGHVGAGQLNALLMIVVSIKCDTVFESLHDKCTGLLDQIVPEKEERAVLYDLYLLRHIEELVNEMNNCRNINGMVQEHLILGAVDRVEQLRVDPVKGNVIKLYLGSNEESNLIDNYKSISEGAKGSQKLLTLLSALDGCHEESVNIKVFELFVSLLTGDPHYNDWKGVIQEKFLSMDLTHLAEWLGKKLLGCPVQTGSGSSTTSSVVRDLAISFINVLLLPASDTKSKELQNHFLNALLLGVETAFLTYDVPVASSYFDFAIQLANGEPAIKQLIQSAIGIMKKLASDENRLEGLKFILDFMISMLGGSGPKKHAAEKTADKSLLNVGVGKLKPNTRKSSDVLLNSVNSGVSSSPIECDAMSADDDEDDATSDGELTSMDKEDDDDSNGERSLASKVCTFTSSGSNFMEQHWYFCYTCDLTVSKGCCSICARVCHRGHKVVYSRLSRFFCDCGAGGVRGVSCLCLKPRKYVSSSTSSRGATNVEAFLPLPDERDQLQPSDSESDFDDDVIVESEKLLNLAIPKEDEEGCLTVLMQMDVENQILSLLGQLLPSLKLASNSFLSREERVSIGEDKLVTYTSDSLQLKKSFKSGSFDMKIKTEYSNARELKSHLSSGAIVKSLVGINSRGKLAVGEGDKVTIFDAGQLGAHSSATPVTADKSNIKPLSRNSVRFELVHLGFNPANENYLAVAGYGDCQVLTITSRGEITDRLPIELALQGAYIRKISWLPGSQVHLMVVTNKFVKIYDLSQDNISPMHYYTLLEDAFVDVAVVPIARGRLVLLVLSQNGILYRHEIETEGYTGAQVLVETIQICCQDLPSKGVSLYFSPSYRLLFLSYQNNVTLIGRLDSEAASITKMSNVVEDNQDGQLKFAGLHHWKELLIEGGLFICLSGPKSNTPLVVSVGQSELRSQVLKLSGSSSAFAVGIAAYGPPSKEHGTVFSLYDDGTLQIFSCLAEPGLQGLEARAHSSALSLEQVKQLGHGILSREHLGAAPEFPLDFFEKTTCITNDIKLGGDAIRNNDSEGVKHNLASEDGFLESSSSAGFKIIVYNSNADIVMVGCRVHVGNTSASHIPREVGIFHRTIKLDEGMRCWYDIPFTNAEALLADEEFTVTIGPTFNGSSYPRIDCLEIYGRAKDDFGWKEKLDAVLDLESHSLNKTSGSSGRKSKSMHTATMIEQVIADGLKLLSCYYTLYRKKIGSGFVDDGLESCRLRSQRYLEMIFQSDRYELLQSAARQVLQALYPSKDIYYQVKDAMRLAGIIHTCPQLALKVGNGGATTTWVIKEFAAQMNAVCKIALHRQENLAAFLNNHGPAVIDGLMDVLWRILELEQPETQVINSIIIPAVELIFSYAECLAFHGDKVTATGIAVAPAVLLLKKLIFAPYEAVQTSCSLAMSSRLLQVPFPKQTMLAVDDAVESARSMPVTADPIAAAAPAGQRMIEEDTSSSSVQYCCDGCSTVPIVRRRWHCNICPDFDLCEACYEMMDGDRLPHPHSRDHPMSAIPIEADSVMGDSSDIQFSMDEFHDDNALQMNSAIHVQNPEAANSAIETSDTQEVVRASQEREVVTLSASKRAVNSLLLNELMKEMKGWMKSTSGSRSLPIMQLFYRLASAVGGPFMESVTPQRVDLESFVKLMLDELDLNSNFNAKTRSSFGEVAILVFMFFTFMLRHWQQPGSEQSVAKPGDSSGSQDIAALSRFSSSTSSDNQDKTDFSSHLERACAALRQQHFVNYLMDILQQLIHVFKSPSRTMDSGSSASTGAACGALLAVKREFPAGNFVPYFSDSYVKAHRADLFSDFHKLLLETTFRLVYTLVRPEKADRQNDRAESLTKGLGAREIKLDGWQEVFCNYISNAHTSFVRKYARRLFLHLCGNKSQYYNVRDAWQINREVKRLDKLVNKSGGLKMTFSYEKSVKLVKCLSALSEVATARPRNWQKYCSRHIDVLQFLLNGIFYFGEESVLQTLKLLNLAFYSGKESGHSLQKSETVDSSPAKPVTQTAESKKKKKGDDIADPNSDKSYLDMEQAAELFVADDGNILRQFVDSFLLEWNSASIRGEAKCVLYGAWHHGKQAFRRLIFTCLLQKIPVLPLYGQNIQEYSEFLGWILGKGTPEQSVNSQEAGLIQACLTSDVIKCIFETLRTQNELLANHPNCRIYNTLSGLVEFDGYYLESEPCVACSCPEVPYTRMKLDSLKSETKFTDNRIIVKCTGSHTIQSVTMSVHDARRSKCVKVLNLYYNNRPVADLSELKNNWSLWKRAKSCHLAFNQTELKVEFPIPITASNFMIELDSFYESLQASSLESLQCPRCSRYVADKHGICGNCHENAYQCRQCRNINYENLDSFLCNECGYSKYGRFEFTFMAKPSFIFDDMENDEDMKKGLAAIEAESENAHRRYQQLQGLKKPLLKLVSSIGETEMDSQQKDKDSVQQMMVSLPGSSSFKINRKIALLGVLYGEKCKAAFDSVSRSVQTLQGLRHVLLNYLERKHSNDAIPLSRFKISGPPNNCYGCATTFVTQCLELLQVLSKYPHCKQQLVSAGILSEIFENNIHQGPKSARVQARSVLCAFSEGDSTAVAQLNDLIKKKVMYCLEHHRSMDIAAAIREEMQLLSESCSIADEFWEARLRIAFQLLFSSIKVGARHPAIAEHIILPCLRIICQACTPPKTEPTSRDVTNGKNGSSLETKLEDSTKVTSFSTGVGGGKSQALSEKDLERDVKNRDVQLLNYAEWEKGASYLDFARRQYKVLQSTKILVQKSRRDSKRADYLALKYALKWKRKALKVYVSNEFSAFEQSSWVSELVLSACSQSIRSEMCGLISVLCGQCAARHSRFLNLLMNLLPATQSAGESSAEFFELLFKMVESEDARLYLTVKGFLRTICTLITDEVVRIEAQERSFHIDISRGYILHKLIELLSKFLEVPNIRSRFMHDGLISQVLEAFVIIRGLIVQKTKLISDCSRLLRELLDCLLDSDANKRHFIRACIAGLQNNVQERRGRTLFILEQLCNIICPSKPEPVYLLVLNKAHTQEEFIRGSMTKNPYSSTEIGPLMRDVKNKICHQLDLLGLLEDDYGMELLVAGNIISLDLSIAQVYEQVWRKAHNQATNNVTGSGVLSVSGAFPGRDCPPMTVTYRLQGLDGEATEPMIKELEEDREETQDPEVEFAIASAVQECGGLNIILSMVQNLKDEELKSNQEDLGLVLKLLMYCCKIIGNRQALLRLGALALLLETARRAFLVDAVEPAEGILLIVESLVMEANESDIGIAESVLNASDDGKAAGEQAAKVVSMFLDRLCKPGGLKMSNKQQRNNEMLARILPYLTYGEAAAMEVLVDHFLPYLMNWTALDELQKKHHENPKDECLSEKAAEEENLAVENFVKLTESIKTNSCGERLKDIIIQKGIARVAVQHLKDVFSVVERGSDFKSSSEWMHGLKLASVPLILSMLRGLARGHLAMQQCIDNGEILPLLHVLESGESEIGVRAENLLDMLADKENRGEGFLAEKVRQLRHATRDEMRRRALLKREKLLEDLGMRRELGSDGGERIVVSKPDIEGLEEVEEEQAGLLACMVCREGYSIRPTDMLGAYSFSKRVNLGFGSGAHSRGEWVYTTVSHFNVIHFQCHQEAKRADASLKNPKKEWEGAALRNNVTLCNCLFPLRGPSVPLPQYVRCVDQFWDSLSSLGRGDGSRLRLLTYDIVLMLARFATGASFSTDCKGGGKESNSKLLPFMIQMAHYLLGQGGMVQRRTMAKALSNYLVSSSSPQQDSPASGSKSSTPSPQRGGSGSTEETVQYMMVQALLLQSLEEWEHSRRTFLQKGIYHAYLQNRHGPSSLTSPASSTITASRVQPLESSPLEQKTDDLPKVDGPTAETNENLYLIVKPMLTYVGLIDQLQRFLKWVKPSARKGTSEEDVGSGKKAKDDGSTGSASLEPWEMTMKERLQDIKGMLGFSKDMLSWLEDMRSSSDMQEGFDIMGGLGDALSGGCPSCDEFVHNAISSGNSK